MRLSPSEIFIGRRQRIDYGKSELEALRRDMEENGQITAVTVRPISDYDREDEAYSGEPWALVAGGRRVMCAALLGWETLEAYAREELKELTHRILELHENLFRKAMTWQEEIDAKAEITRLRRQENPEITDAEIARELGVNAGSLSKDLKTARILEANPGLRTANSKHAALNAGKLLEEHQLRAARVSSQPTERSDLGIPPLEDRVRTSEAVEYAKHLPARSIDFACLDGPYGYNYWKSGQKSSAAEMANKAHLSYYDDDAQRAATTYRELLPELVRAMRETGWLLFFCGKETYDFIEELAGDCCAVHASYRHDQYPKQCTAAVLGANASGGECRFLRPEVFPWYWYRPNSRNQPRYAYLHAKNFGELILVINMGKGRLVRPGTPNVKVHDAEYGQERIHGNQKPIALYRDLIQDFTFAGDSVLDCFFGSGNSLAAAASLGRIPWGCDKNPEMLPFARGSIQKYQQPVTKDAIAASHRRYQQGLQMELPSDDDAVQEEGAISTEIYKQANEIYKQANLKEMEQGAELYSEVLHAVAGERFRVSRAAAEGFIYETLKLPGGEWLGYIKYDGHNLGQRRATSEDALEGQLMQDCETLNSLVSLGVLDPCCCTPEEVMKALTYEEETEDA